VIFTSYTYVAFLAIAFFIHWVLPTTWRKPFLIVASYVFYCSWKWQFAFLLLGLSLFNWAYGRWVLPRATSTSPLIVGIGANLAALVYFKYTNFILVNVAAAVGLFGAQWRPSLSDIVLPLGLSFFTFQGIAYLFDVATGEPPLEGLMDFLFFKAFWCQLIAGPIIRLSEIRDQIATERTIAYGDVADGSRRILFGFFKKVVLADNLAPYVTMVFSSAATPNVLDAVVGILGFGLQIYFDFSAYSDIAIGTARLFGYRFPENFDWPYAATSPQEFWNRWHMTLSRWIRDYLFTPMMFAARKRPRLAPLWLLIAMALCGLWHGAQWTFVVWGLWHGLLLLLNQSVLRPVFLSSDARARASRWHRIGAQALTFLLVQAGWALFRAGSIKQAVGLWWAILTLRGGLRPAIARENIALFVFVMLAAVLGAQCLRPRVEKFAAGEILGRWGGVIRPLVYAVLIFAIVVFDQEAKTFVYFQF
jgi:alginate O-acetyltransferase complex protein AlgI